MSTVGNLVVAVEQSKHSFIVVFFLLQEHTSNGPTSLTENRDTSPAVLFVPENQSIQCQTPEKESRETDALLATRS